MTKDMHFREAEKLIKDNGFKYIRAKGSHHIFSDGTRNLILTVHSKSIKRQTMSKIIKRYQLQ